MRGYVWGNVQILSYNILNFVYVMVGSLIVNVSFFRIHFNFLKLFLTYFSGYAVCDSPVFAYLTYYRL